MMNICEWCNKCENSITGWECLRCVRSTIINIEIREEPDNFKSKEYEHKITLEKLIEILQKYDNNTYVSSIDILAGDIRLNELD